MLFPTALTSPIVGRLTFPFAWIFCCTFSSGAPENATLISSPAARLALGIDLYASAGTGGAGFMPPHPVVTMTLKRQSTPTRAVRTHCHTELEH